MTDKAKAICYKDGKPVKTYYNVSDIRFDKKYNYWILTERIFHHDIITIHRLNEFDKVIAVDKNGEKEIEP